MVANIFCCSICSLIPSPLPQILSHSHGDKIWEWPGNELLNLYVCSFLHISSVMVISMKETGWLETDMARASLGV